jgi:hypothetical protein
MISVDDYLVFVDEALDGMVAIVEELGDDLANRRLDVPDTNSPYVLLTHCLGVMEFWAGHLVAGRPTARDRDAEFVAHGPVADLVARTRRAREQMHRDAASADLAAPLRNSPAPDDADLPLGRTQGGALFHVYEELAQHRGQMEASRDVLLAPWGRLA